MSAMRVALKGYERPAHHTTVLSLKVTDLDHSDDLFPICSCHLLICLLPWWQWWWWCSEDSHLPGRQVERDGVARGCNME